MQNFTTCRLVEPVRHIPDACGSVTAEPPATVHSQWVYPDRSGKLVYQQLKTGDRIIDFSYAGYGGGGIALPNFPVKKAVTPSGEDDTAAIQSAIDEASRLPLLHGVRGAVLLAGGHFHCNSTLKLTADGFVLRGSGSGKADIVIEMTGDPHLAISVAGESSIKPIGAPTEGCAAHHGRARRRHPKHPHTRRSKAGGLLRQRNADSLRSLQRHRRQRLLHRSRSRNAGAKRRPQLHLSRQRPRAAASALVHRNPHR